MKIFLGNGKCLEGELSNVDVYIDNSKQKIDGYVIDGRFYDLNSFRKIFTKYMNISEAWEAMKQGKEVKLEEWPNNKYMYLTKDGAYLVFIDRERCYLNHQLSQSEYTSNKWIVREK